MGVKIGIQNFDKVLNLLKKDYKIYGPKIINNKGRFSDTDIVGYEEIETFDDIEFNKKSYFSPKEIIHPIRQTLFYFTDGEITEPKVNDKKVIIFLRPCGINGIKRLDTMFLQNGDYEDFYYKRLREKVKFFMIECTKGFDNCYCVSMKANKTDNYSLAIRVNDNAVYLDIKDSEIKDYFNGQGDDIDFQPDYIKENKIKVKIPDPKSVGKEIFENPIWREYTERCIGCGRCNTSCITCSCFSMQDVLYDRDEKVGERRRVWAGCHIDGFTEMAGGHSFRKKYGDRMRFKTMHKINDFYRRFGYHMCVGCGRCTDVCPQYISFPRCINKLNQIVEVDKNE